MDKCGSLSTKQQYLHNNVGSSQDKTKLTSSVLKGKLGFPNQVETFGGERSKGCLIYLSVLPEDVNAISKGTEFNECGPCIPIPWYMQNVQNKSGSEGKLIRYNII